MLIAALSLIAGLLLLTFGGELLLRGAVGLSRRLGFSTLLIGMTVVACATSLPELVVTLIAGLAGRPNLGVGNIIGSNIANTLMILGVIGVVCVVPPPARSVRRDALVMAGATLTFLFFAWLAPVSWPHGLLLLGLLALYLYRSYRDERRRAAPPSTETREALAQAPRRLGLAVTAILLGTAALILGSHLLIEGATVIARAAGVSDAIIGLTLVAVGTSLPELATSLVAALRRHPEVALGNIVGSNIFNVLGILGTLALATPFAIPQELLDLEVWVLTLSTLGLGLLLWRRAPLGRPAGFALLVVYGAFIAGAFSPEVAPLTLALQ